ncbi:protein-disulfide reductase DsbD domain-containing protein [Rhizobium sp. PL01]|uniref:protein-disulfide reductase DsbD domain-containing protein n=1 Tax=Rhizobium sp. PL01 TaxID=3085631 RepID=UPI002980F1D8|nr:protein-disulfide reductase DsbD domain-containing protein [Rhizobium sp. PL01]MDW5314297.1 protein-disulfide reductase DsbD family protein [Rhizobium sp. PL01]
MAALATLSAYFFIAPAANAAQSQWVQSQGGEVRIVADRPEPDGTIPAILDIRLKPGWKTYWVEPGASGIPPQITVDPKDGISFSGLRFPAPKAFHDGIASYTGYDRSVAFPLSLRREKTGSLTLKASVFLGICKDICIPVQADLHLSLPEGLAQNPLDRARIDDAVAALPMPPSDTFKVTAASFDAAENRLHLSLVTPAAAMPAELFLSGPPGYSFGKPENVTAENGKVTAEIAVRVPAKGDALKSGSVLLVARAGEQSIETPLAFD